MAIQSLGGLSAAQRTILEDRLEYTAFPRLIHGRWGKRRAVGPREGRAVTFARLTQFGVATTALSEGVAPEGEALTFTTATVTPSRYGSFAYLTDELVDKGIFDIVVDVTDLLGAQSGRTSDRLVRELLRANGTSQNADNVAEASQTVANVLDAEELLEALSVMEENDAQKFPELGDAYPLLMHPRVIYDLERDPMLRNSFYYAAPRGPENPAIAGFVGKGRWMDVMFFTSSDAYVNADGGSGTTDTYHSLLIGREHHAVAGYAALLADYAEGGTFKPGEGSIRPVEIIVHGREAYPPLNQRESVAWKIDQGQVELNSAFMLRIISSSSIAG